MKLSNKTKIWGAIGLAVLTTGLILAFKKPKTISKKDAPKKGISGNRFPLQTGSGMGDKAYQSDDVKTLQTKINLMGAKLAPLAPLVVDGKFGVATATALDHIFQTKRVNEEMFNKL